MKTIPYDDRYRDDLIFMVLEAKNALGRVPGLNEDLLDIKANYFDKGDMFWIAIDKNNRVIGSVGYNSINGTTEILLHRLFVKYNMKRNGIGTLLLQTAENHARLNGKTVSRVHLGTPKDQWFESYHFYQKNGYTEYKEHHMKKQL